MLERNCAVLQHFPLVKGPCRGLMSSYEKYSLYLIMSNWSVHEGVELRLPFEIR